MRTKASRIAAAFLALALLGAACGDDDDTPASTGSTEAPEVTTAPDGGDDMTDEDAAEPGDIVATADAAGDFTVLLEAATAAGLVDELQGPGPLTVFAPTDDAFAAALESLGVTKEELLSDPDALASILLYHVVDGAVMAEDVIALDGQDVETLNGATVAVSVVDGSVMLNDEVTVTATDIEASNGIIHVIDAVLLPPAA
jgi:transforming growth factor-beta-induced protein